MKHSRSSRSGGGNDASSTKKTTTRADGERSAPKFVIPRKKQDSSLFHEIALDSREYQSDIWPILKRHSFRPPQHHDVLRFRYTKCTLVSNETLLNKFEEKRKEMKQAKLEASVSYGFWQAFNQNEVTSICQNGLSSNYAQGTLGRPDLGVYLSQYADVPTAAPLLDGVVGTLVVFKVLKGRAKLVPAHTSGHLEPAPNYECHAPKLETASTSATMEQSPYRVFESALLYLYDYVDIDLQTPPRCVCPIAVIEYVYEDRANAPHWLRSELHLWTGGLRFDNGRREDFETNLRLVSHLAKMKPPHLGRQVMIKKLVKTDACFQWTPLEELRSGVYQGVLYKQRRDLRLPTGHYISIYRLMQHRKSDKYLQLISAIYKNDLVGLASLPEGGSLLIFPASHFSCQLGIPPFRDAPDSLYCMVLAFRSLVTGTGYIRDPYEGAIFDSAPADSCIVNPNQLAAISQLYVEKCSFLGAAKVQSTPATDASSVATAQPAVPDANAKDSKGAVEAEKAAVKRLLRDPRLQKRMNAVPTDALPSKGTSGPERGTETGQTDVVQQGDDGNHESSEIRIKRKAESSGNHPKRNAPESDATCSKYLERTVSEEKTTDLPLDVVLMSVIYGSKAKERLEAVSEPEDSKESVQKAIQESDVVAPAPADDAVAVSAVPDARSSPDIPHGAVVPDDLVLTRADPGEVKKVLDIFKLLRERKIADWHVRLHSQVVLKLANMKKNLSAASIQHKRATEMLTLFHSYRKLGIVDLLAEHECDKHSRSAAEYLPCLQQLKQEWGDHQIILLSNLSPESEVAKGFHECNISVMNLQALANDFVNL